eukprot:CAMPEP_0169398096 /NCGR_PEP_ID=MMETSP1017-20121227/52422_1 /TAXON_ID=342587 /ORGANISM="Karlodinium micrum, Strain CCMP2283" /LENGTH=66 /DNA_ID=CAMNT_0009502985 /DNA_START=48 /DNA_END=245 /DNA_ORIENTATION=-
MRDLLLRYATGSTPSSALLAPDGVDEMGSIHAVANTRQGAAGGLDWIKMPILFTFSDERGTCSAPG